MLVGNARSGHGPARRRGPALPIDTSVPKREPPSSNLRWFLGLPRPHRRTTPRWCGGRFEFFAKWRRRVRKRRKTPNSPGGSVPASSRVVAESLVRLRLVVAVSCERSRGRPCSHPRACLRTVRPASAAGTNAHRRDTCRCGLAHGASKANPRHPNERTSPATRSALVTGSPSRSRSRGSRGP